VGAPPRQQSAKSHPGGPHPTTNHRPLRHQKDAHEAKRNSLHRIAAGSQAGNGNWTVGSGSLHRKPVDLLDVAPAGRGAHVRMALEYVLSALDARVTHQPVSISAHSQGPTGEICDAAILDRLRTVVGELAQRARVAGKKNAESLIDARRHRGR
jgi:hypothetical protein